MSKCKVCPCCGRRFYKKHSAPRKKRDRDHGMTGTPTWQSWSCMKARCNRESHTAYKRYGGRGIKYQDSWENFLSFLADMGERPKGTTLERINNDIGYTKDNCRWATPKEQARNRSSCRAIEYKGEVYSIPILAEKLGLKLTTLYARIKFGRKIDAPLRSYEKVQDL